MTNGCRLLVVLLTFATRSLSGATPTFDQWAEQISAEWVRLSPQVATRIQYFSGSEQDALDRELTATSAWGGDYGRAASEKRAVLARQGLQQLRQFSRESLTRMQRSSAALLEWTFSNAIRTSEFAGRDAVFRQMRGLQLDLVNFMTQTHPIRNRRDVENYVARLGRVGPVIDQGIAEARAAASAGFIEPRFIVERTIEQVDGLLLHAAKDSVFVSSLRTRLAALGTAVTAQERERFLQEAERLTTDSVLPSFRRVREFLAGVLPDARDDAGLWRFPAGAKQYANTLETFTTTHLDAEQIHAIGLREVARLEGEMDVILRQLGYMEGTVNARYEALDRALQPAAEPDPRPAILALNEKWVRDAERRAAELFDLLPKAPVVVKREPLFSERTAAAHYSPPAPDGSEPGVYWLPLPGPLFGMLRTRSLCYHEAVPGHHFQLAVQQELKELPRFRTLGAFGFISAHGEGWGLYAERLADESGWYAGDPQGRLGYLNSMLFRARRLVVDTGLHTKKWTRQQAIDYGINAQEVERYVVMPGQACSYMIGQLRIVELREAARAKLGAKFSLKDFHNVVLRCGNVPLDVLAQEVDAWTHDVAP